jgi:hypothetical protein
MNEYSYQTDEEKCRKNLAWLLRAFTFNEDDEKIVLIDDVIEKYKIEKKENLLNDAKFVFCEFQVYQRDHYKILNKISREVRDYFNRYRDCDECCKMDGINKVKVYLHPCACKFDDKYEKFLNENTYTLWPITKEIINRTVKKYPTQFIIKNDRIRAIRSWETK